MTRTAKRVRETSAEQLSVGYMYASPLPVDRVLMVAADTAPNKANSSVYLHQPAVCLFKCIAVSDAVVSTAQLGSMSRIASLGAGSKVPALGELGTSPMFLILASTAPDVHGLYPQ